MKRTIFVVYRYNYQNYTGTALMAFNQKADAEGEAHRLKAALAPSKRFTWFEVRELEFYDL